MRVLLLEFLTIFAHISTQDSGGTLQSCQIFFRHGERVLTDISAILPRGATYTNIWEYEFGELTNNGIRQAFQLGLKLREDYGDFIGTKYVPSKLRVYTGEDNRTITSALSVLAGLFPPKEEQIWNHNLLWQPIPVHSDFAFDSVGKNFSLGMDITDLISFYNEVSFGALDHCPGLADFVYRHPKYVALLEATAERRAFVHRMTGLRMESVYDYEKFLDMLLTVKKAYPKALPKWEKEVTVDELENLKLTLHQNLINILLPQTGGFLLDTVLNAVENDVKHIGNHSLIMYSTHDTTALTIAMYLNITELFKLSDFCSLLIFEHHKIAGQNIIKVWYTSSLNDTKKEVFSPYCDGFPCTVEKLRRIVPRISRKKFLQFCEFKSQAYLTSAPLILSSKIFN